MKKKILVTLGIVVGVVVIAIVVLVANLGKIVNSRKDTLLAQVESRIGRDISVGDVGVAIWPEIGVRVRDVVLSEDPAWGAEPFVRVADLRVNVALMPLLRRRVEVKRFVLREPDISVIKGDAGRFNFTSLVEAGAGAGDGRPAPGGAAVPLVLAFADIENGTVRYADRAKGVDRVIRDIDFSAKDVSLDSRVTATLAAAVFGETQDVRVEAAVGPVGKIGSPEELSRTPISATISMEPVRLSALQSAPAPGAPARPAPDGDVGMDGTLSGTIGAAMFDEITIRVTMRGATKPNVEVTATAGPFNLLADSTLVFADAHVKGNLTAGPIPLDGVALKSADPKKPAPKVGGQLSATAAFEGAPSAIAFTGRADATGASYEIEQQFSKPAGLPATAEFQGTFRPEKSEREGIEFTSIDLAVHALRAKGKGRLVTFKGRESMSFSFDATSAIAPWKDHMPALATYAPTGDVRATVQITGAPVPGAEPDIRGTAAFSNVTAVIPQVPNPVSNGTGTAVFTAKTARIDDATFTIGKSAFRMKADISSFQPMTSTYTVTSGEVWRADVQIAAPGAPKPPRPEVFRDVTAQGTATETAPKVVHNDVRITSKKGIASNLDYTDATASVRATPDKVFIDGFDAKILGGKITGTGTLEPLASKFDVTTRVTDANLAEYFRYKAPALVDVLAGRIDADFSLSGSGKTWEDLQKTLAGKGGAIVIEGALLNVNFARQLFSSIQGLPMVPPDLTARMAAKNPKLFESNTTVFKNLTGNVTIADGKFQVPDLKLASPDFSLVGAGWFSLGKDMSMNTTLTLSDKLTRDLVEQVPVAKFLLAESGRLEVPLTLSGAVARPNVAVDASVLSGRLQQSLTKQGQEGLNTQLKGLLDGLKKKEAPKKP